MTTTDRLSALDASFLHLESAETPMHVGTLAVFEGDRLTDPSGRFCLAAVRALVASRLHLIPRFRRRLMTVPFEQGRPIWVDDDHFDISYHVRLTALPKPGSWDELLALTARIEAQPLDRRRPLWELWFVEGLEAGRVGLVQKTHHALVDGVAGVDVATVLLDFEPDVPVVSPPTWSPAPSPSNARLLADTVMERATERTELIRTARGVLRAPQRTAQQANRVGHALRSLVESVPIAPRTSLRGAVGRRRAFVGARVPLDEVGAVRHELGGTVNDVVLACVAGALRRRLVARGDAVPDHLRVLCPVSLRTGDQQQELGNQISAMFLDLPIGESDPVTRLATIRAATAHLKEQEQAAGAAFLLGMTRYAAPTMLGMTARLVHRQPFVNLVVTNVPGPPVPLYCMGARMLEAFPLVPLSRNLGLGIAILSYCNVLHFGLWADADLHPDLGELGRDVEAAFAELSQAGAPHAVDRGAVG
ncbi:MAG: wax ester/triacylglycerol synthase family O-acyltransferase [Acidimicrobiia bacterium]